jgi:hypothetical protein
MLSITMGCWQEEWRSFSVFTAAGAIFGDGAIMGPCARIFLLQPDRLVWKTTSLHEKNVSDGIACRIVDEQLVARCSTTA